MFPYWEDVIAPLIESVGAQRIIEIGALRGETTVRMLDRLGADAELHVIDPLPQFDPAEHERAFPGRYVFHRGLSHDVLPTLAAADVALVDGDHNWYTVYHELKMLDAPARAAGRPLPLLIMHDVGWPYGRRDLYYAPEQIPAEFRQPYGGGGMRPGISKLRPIGGLNLELANADHEGGPRNGVYTALEDFAAEHDRPLRIVVLHAYFGLAIVAEERLVDAHPNLRSILDHLETLEAQRDLVELGERIRIEEAIVTQSWLRHLDRRVERSIGRYLETVKAALLDEHYIDNEVRLDHLGRLIGQKSPDLTPLRDPARLLRQNFQRISQARAAGRGVDGGRNVAFFPYTDVGRARLDRLEVALDEVRTKGIAGDLADIGVGRGGVGIFLRAYLAAHEITDRSVWSVDEFAATRPETATATGGEGETAANADDQLTTAVGRFGADLNQVRDGYARFGVFDDSVRFLQGAPPEQIAGAADGRLALVHLGAELGTELPAVLEAVTPRLAPGAIVIVGGTADSEREAAVVATRARLGIDAPLEHVDWNSVAWTMPTDAPQVAPTAEPAARPGAGLHLEPPAPKGTVALSVVVVFYNMQREARRTLQSLTRSYQRDIEDLQYEVIVIDNGSRPDQRLTAADVSAYGPEFHLLDMGAHADPSPTVALNAGIALSSGENLALMIDGAHVLTPGVLHHGMVALAAYAPAVVATQQWYVGPGQQPEMLHEGYDQRAEDLLFDRIEWPVDGYRLFEVGQFIGERDWFDGIVESNCLFVSRKLLEQNGGFDDRFSMPGGGYANLDLFERLALAPGVSAASILGEGSFHQFHGGTTTNVDDAVEHRDRISSYGRHFTEVRGRPLAGLDRPIKYVGSLNSTAAKRTRARRVVSGALDAMRDPVAHDAAAGAIPVSDELKLAAIEALWDRKAWKEATWLGHRVNRYPTDLQNYQELIVATRPDVVVVTGDDDGLGGRALFCASILDNLGHGHVIAVGTSPGADRPAHARITHVDGRADDADIAARVTAEAAAHGAAMVFLALGAHQRVINAFERYAPLVPAGGYVVVENTVVNGRPAAPGFGAGPLEGVFQILGKHSDFVADHTLEQYTITFNRGGYLRRLERR